MIMVFEVVEKDEDLLTDVELVVDFVHELKTVKWFLKLNFRCHFFLIFVVDFFVVTWEKVRTTLVVVDLNFDWICCCSLKKKSRKKIRVFKKQETRGKRARVTTSQNKRLRSTSVDWLRKKRPHIGT